MERKRELENTRLPSLACHSSVLGKHKLVKVDLVTDALQQGLTVYVQE